MDRLNVHVPVALAFKFKLGNVALDTQRHSFTSDRRCWMFWMFFGAFCIAHGLLRSGTCAAATVPVYDIQLRETFRFVGETPIGIIGKVTDIEEQDGRAVLFDGQLGTIQTFDANGTNGRTILAPGEGPGELDYASAFTLIDSRRLVACAYSPRKLKVLVPDRQEIEELAVVPEHRIIGVGYMDAPGVLVIHQSKTERDGAIHEQVIRFAAATLEGLSDADTLRTSFIFGNPLPKITTRKLGPSRYESIEQEIRCMTDSPPRWSVGPDRLYLAAEYGAYMINVIGPEGEELGSFGRPSYQERIRTAQEKSWISTQYEGSEVTIFHKDPDIVAVYARKDSSVWVVPSDGCNAQDHDKLEFDVFGRDGRYVARLRFSIDLRLDRVLPLSLYRDAVFVTDTALYVISERFPKYAETLEPEPPLPVVIRFAFLDLPDLTGM